MNQNNNNNNDTNEENKSYSFVYWMNYYGELYDALRRDDKSYKNLSQQSTPDEEWSTSFFDVGWCAYSFMIKCY